MHWINTDIYRATVAWIFMLLSAILLLLSFGNNGEATALTFFYLAVIMLMGLFLYITVTKPWEEKLDNETKNNCEAVKKEPLSQDKGDHNLAQFAGADKDIQYLDTEKFVMGLVSSDTKKEESVEKLLERTLSVIANKFDAVQGIMYCKDAGTDTYSSIANYAYYSDKSPPSFKLGETLPGQAAKNRKLLNINNVPEGYMTVLSGLGSSYPRNLVIIPLLFKNETVAVIELASFKPFTEKEEDIFNQLAPSLGNDIGSLIKARAK